MRKSGSTGAARLSRRTLIGAAPALSTVVNVSAQFPLNNTVAQCAAWIVVDLEIDRLALRWAKLEARMQRDHGWLTLNQAERRALPDAAEMFQIDDKPEALSDQRERMLEPLSRLPAGTLHEIASKLVIAARLMRHEDSPAQPFVASVVRELAQMRCPSCGAAQILGGAVRGSPPRDPSPRRQD